MKEKITLLMSMLLRGAKTSNRGIKSRRFNDENKIAVGRRRRVGHFTFKCRRVIERSDMKKSLAVLIAFAFADTSHAAIVQHQSTISKIYPQANGSVALVFQTQNASCTNSSNYYYIKVGENGMTIDGMKNLYSAALAAAAGGQSVTVYFESTSPDCFVNRLHVAY